MRGAGGDLQQARSDVYPLGAAQSGQIKQFCKKFPADAFGRRNVCFLNRSVVATMAVHPLPSQPIPPSRKHLSHLNTLASGWSDLLGLRWVGGGPLCSGLYGLF